MTEGYSRSDLIDENVGVKMIDTLRFINYKLARRNGMSAVRGAVQFPRGAEFEVMLTEEIESKARTFGVTVEEARRQFFDLNAGARAADDVFSPSGERGRSFDRQEVPTYQERLYGGR